MPGRGLDEIFTPLNPEDQRTKPRSYVVKARIKITPRTDSVETTLLPLLNKESFVDCFCIHHIVLLKTLKLFLLVFWNSS